MRVPLASSIPAEMVVDVLEGVWETASTGSVGLLVTLSGSGSPPELVFASVAAARMFGYEPAEFLAVPLLQHLDTEALAVLRERRRRGAAGGPQERRFELWIRRKDGTRGLLDVTTARQSIGGRQGNVTLLHDLSHRQLAAEALQASEARFRTVVESAPDGVVILRGPQVVYANTAAAHMLGYSEASGPIGRSISDLIHPDDAGMARTRIQSMLDTGKRHAEPKQYRSRRVDGREISVEISSIPIEYEGGPAVLAFARDITERNSIQEKLVQADRLAAVGTLAAGIAHEINNPLAYVLLGLQYLERELPKAASEPARLQELLGRIKEVKSGAERVGTIVRDLKTFARADEVQRGAVDLKSVIEAALKIADNEIRHRATLVRDYADVPPVEGNPARLEQVFLNLLVNAAHAVSDVDPSRSEVLVRLRTADAGGAVIAEVSDNGTGIPPEVLGRVFDPFFTTKPIGVGTGLGLPICRSIVESFGGQIELLSEPGRGTTAKVVLPVFAGRERGRSDAPGAPSAPPTARSRVLVVDDEPLVASLLERMLAPLHDVSIATNGKDALEAIFSSPFDAIICDVMMPGMTGMDVYNTLRARDPQLAERVVFMTGGAFVPRVAAFLATVENPTLEKPFQLSSLQSVLRLMGRRTLDEELTEPE